MYNFVQKTKQNQATFMAFNFFANFATEFFTQFSPEDPFQKEL